ncbi:uncharacterized protein FIBRA_02924 [Fibroporia radiculosa]|uniref:Uncharacterized protein n=1 Tax=Fibroporia radiculosa TaxID=599839 RepID=J4G3F4_9APHY|nr:uncharacterized protein FIBRA_02924 [Fibroporia radiculosa]CCM00878.1 predicted protein [Fibroporia radiculosa]
MSSSPATAPHMRSDELVPGPEVRGDEMHDINDFAGTPGTGCIVQPLGSVSRVPSALNPDSNSSTGDYCDVYSQFLTRKAQIPGHFLTGTIEHSIQLPIEIWDKAIDYAVEDTHNGAWLRNLGCVDTLSFRCGVWRPYQLHPQVFIHVTVAFGSVKVLTLEDMMFPSALVFGQLVRALPQLSSLTCRWVGFKSSYDVVGRIWELHPLRLDTVQVWDYDDVVDFFVSRGARLRSLSWSGAQPDIFSKLVTATAESLVSLHIGQVHVSSKDPIPSGFYIDLTPAHVNLHTLSISSDVGDLDGAAHIVSRVSLPRLRGQDHVNAL